jgi:hypothetical protein
LYCNRCGHNNPQGANFCSSCGARLQGSLAEPEPTTTALPPVVLVPSETGDAFQLEPSDLLYGVPEGGGVLVVTRGPNAGSRYVLSPQRSLVVTIGRHPDSDIFLDDITVSRRHAEISYNEGVFWAHDVGSLNGTYLNRQSIENAPLASGDELQVGKFRLLFLSPPQAQA